MDMCYVMMFPKTVDEFMEQYKIVDTDEVYTNGAELVPIFRMKQWFEHEPPVKHGHWIRPYNDHYKQCSVCGRVHYSIPWNAEYCPFCGAKMEDI